MSVNAAKVLSLFRGTHVLTPYIPAPVVGQLFVGEIVTHTGMSIDEAVAAVRELEAAGHCDVIDWRGVIA